MKNPGYRRIALTRSAANAGMFVYITASPFVFLRLLNLSAFSFGWVFGTNALALMIGGLANGLLLKKHAPDKLFSGAIVLVLIFGVLSAVSGFLPPTLATLMIPLIGFLFGLGMIMPTSTALALKGHGKHTGSASALLGSLQYAVAFAVSGAVSLFPEGGVLTMTLGIGCCGLVAAALHFINRPPRLAVEAPASIN
jgi:DHA1 family bicyclomycin/chloramphenicol resistance-like MFS transporter